MDKAGISNVGAAERGRTLLFDFDNTLYTNRRMAEHQADVLYRFVAEKTGLSLEEAKRSFDERLRKFAQQFGVPVSRSWGIPIWYASGAEWNAYRDEHIAARGYLERDERLIAVFERLRSQRFDLAVASNSPQKFIREALGLLGIEAKVVSSDLVHAFKPSIDFFWLATHHLEVQPEACISIGDRDCDISPANALGIRGIRVRSVQDVYHIDDYIQRLDKSGETNLLL
ncbi:HAD family hydrolase [Candidatus Woesearchaeota archaeon]|nr:HAD family hydrolase [Candidatus Woesearchaeota archaeon]